MGIPQRRGDFIDLFGVEHPTAIAFNSRLSCAVLVGSVGAIGPQRVGDRRTSDKLTSVDDDLSIPDVFLD
jgi:hypothetical protein